MFLVNLSKREKILFYLTVTVVVFSLVYNFALKPLGTKWRQLNRRILDKEIELQRNVRYLQQQDKIRNIYQKYSGYAKDKGSDEEEMASLLNEAERQARAANIHITNIRPKPIKDLQFYKKYAIEMNCEASMEKYIDFIYSLQSSSRLVRVEKLKLVSQGKDNPLLKCQLLVGKIVPAQ